MLISMVERYKRAANILTLMICLLPLFCFKKAADTALLAAWANRCLTESFDPRGDAKLKKWEISVTPDMFVRLRKTYAKGKQEYYSFSLGRFRDMNYWGTTKAGRLDLLTVDDDIISQTYNDRKGDMDKMVNLMSLPVKNMQAERLDSLRNILMRLKDEANSPAQ